MEMKTNSRKPKEVFDYNRLIHKKLSQFCNRCYHLRDSNSFLCPIFQGLNYLIISCFSHKFSERIPINWREILKNQENFLFITNSFSLSFCTGFPDREIWRRLWDPNFQKFAKFPQIWFAIFGLIVFKYFELSCNCLKFRPRR